MGFSVQDCHRVSLPAHRTPRELSAQSTTAHVGTTVGYLQRAVSVQTATGG